jgi:hypothetical protein
MFTLPSPEKRVPKERGAAPPLAAARLAVFEHPTTFDERNIRALQT